MSADTIAMRARRDAVRQQLLSRRLGPVEERDLQDELVRLEGELAELEHAELAVRDPEQHRAIEAEQAIHRENEQRMNADAAALFGIRRE